MKKPILFGILLTACVIIVAFVFSLGYPGGMISYWKFDESSGTTANDSADANDGTIYGATWTTGQVDGALNFDGVNDYVKVPDHASLDFSPGQDFSLEAWIKANADQAKWQGTILAKLNAPNQPSGSNKRDYGYSLMVRGLQDTNNEGKIGVWLGDGYGLDGPFQLYSVETYDDDTWHHVVATMDRDGLARLYVDGSEVNNADISYLSTVDESNFENLEIGREGVYDTYLFNGLIDEVAIYNRVLSAEEINQHYQRGSYEAECVLPPLDIISWWPGDGNTQDIVDCNNGIAYGVTYEDGEVGDAFSFDGGNDRIDLGNPAALKQAFSHLTIDAWVKPSQNMPKATVISCTEWDGWAMRIFDGQLRADLRLTDGYVAVTAGIVQLNVWSHVAITYDQSFVRAFINGTEVGNAPGSGTIGNVLNASTNVFIGNEPTGTSVQPGYAFYGLIDEVEIFGRALDASEIQAIYNAGSAGKCRVIPVAIDIKPGSYPNCFNSNSHGVIPVAILGSANFDVSIIDPFSVQLNGQSVRVKGKSGNAGSLEDVNGDGYLDLVIQILDDGVYEVGDSIGIVTAVTLDGKPIEGKDSICITQD